MKQASTCTSAPSPSRWPRSASRSAAALTPLVVTGRARRCDRRAQHRRRSDSVAAARTPRTAGRGVEPGHRLLGQRPPDPCLRARRARRATSPPSSSAPARQRAGRARSCSSRCATADPIAGRPPLGRAATPTPTALRPRHPAERARRRPQPQLAAYSGSASPGYYNSGRRPASEPETRSLEALPEQGRSRLRRQHPHAAVRTRRDRCQGPGVRAAAVRRAQPARPSPACNGGCHGTMSDWFNYRHRGAYVTIEFGVRPEHAAADRRRTARAASGRVGGHYQRR